MESIKEFFKSIDMEEYINSLPDKYETILGENGNNLSGGQKKSISIGRAMLRDFQILLLDEATTSLDNNRKEHLLKVIRKFRGEKTIVMVTHDISDVEDFDKIIVMDKGKIIGLGNHKDLLKQCDAYNKLFYKNGKITA
jgi:ABC-type multidrug transport system fused ATPase/permease subunit